MAVERALAAGGDRVETLLTEAPRHAAELAAAASHSYDRLYVFGGDGAFNEVVNGLEADVPVGFLPGGGTSVLSRALGLPRDPVDCARVLAGSVREQRISLGRVNGRRFTFSAGLGLDAELIRRVDDLGRQDGKRPSDLVFARALTGILAGRRFRLQPALTVSGHGRAAFALVANCDPYTYVGSLPIHATPTARFELGLDLVAPRALAPWQLPRLAAWAFAGRGQVSSAGALYLHDVDEIEVECDVPLPLQVDGEDLGDVDSARFEAERDALRVVVGDTLADEASPRNVFLGGGTGASGRTGRSADHRRWGRGGGRRGRGSRRRCAPGPLSRDGPAPNLRRALGGLPPTGSDRDVRDLLGPRGDPGRLGARAGRRGLDLPVLPRVCDRAPARDAPRDRARRGGAGIPPAGGIRRSSASRRSPCRSRRTSRTRSATPGARSSRGGATARSPTSATAPPPRAPSTRAPTSPP